jgi:hypothetical protein
MKKTLFLLALFSISGIIIYFMMKGVGSEGSDIDLKNVKDQRLVAMVDSIESAEWKNNKQYRRIQTEIGMSESNGKIDLKDKNLLLSTLDTKYAISLTKKYNAIKTTFTSFPSSLYNEMLAFQSKNSDLPTGVRELNAFIQLQNMESYVTQFLNSKYSELVISNLRSKVNGLPLGALASHPNSVKMKNNYLNDLASFEKSVKKITKYMELCDQDENENNSDGYLIPLTTFSEIKCEKYNYYREWFIKFRAKQKKDDNN